MGSSRLLFHLLSNDSHKEMEQSQLKEMGFVLQAEHSRCPTAAELTTRLGASLDAISDTLSRGLRAKHALLHANKRLVFKLAHSFGFDRRVPYEEYVLVRFWAFVVQFLMEKSEGLLNFHQGNYSA